MKADSLVLNFLVNFSCALCHKTNYSILVFSTLLKLQIPNKIWILEQSPFTSTQSVDIRGLYVHRLVYTYLHPYIHTYKQAYIHTYIISQVHNSVIRQSNMKLVREKTLHTNKTNKDNTIQSTNIKTTVSNTILCKA